MNKKKVTRRKKSIGKVYIHNNLVDAQFSNLGLIEGKLLVVVAYFFQQAQLQQLVQTNFVSFTLDELAEYLKVNKNNFPYLREKIKNIQTCFISYQNELEQWEADIPLFEPAKYHYRIDGGRKTYHKIDFQINEKLIPFFTNLGKEAGGLVRPYTQLEGATTQDFTTSKYTLILYILLKKLENQEFKMKSYSLSELQSRVGSKYPTWQKFRDNVLDPSVKEINELSEIWCEYIPKREKQEGKGRPKIVGVTFKMGLKEAYKAKKEATKKALVLKNFKAGGATK
jgi:hypothetical protein